MQAEMKRDIISASCLRRKWHPGAREAYLTPPGVFL